MLKKTLIFITIPFAISACSAKGQKTTVVEAMQKKDKNLSCKELLLEMNEADFYRNNAHKSRGPKLKNVLMPLGYISTYMNAEEAIEAAEARVGYLDKIYEIMHCSEKDEELQKMPVYKEYKETPAPTSALPEYKPGPTSSVGELPLYEEPVRTRELPLYKAEISPDKFREVTLEKDIPIGGINKEQPIEYEYSGVKLYERSN